MTALLEKISDARHTRSEAAAAALNDVVANLAGPGDVDPCDVLDVCEASGITENNLQNLVADYIERQRLLDLADTADKIRKQLDAAEAARTKAQAGVQRAKAKLTDARLEYVEKRSSASKLLRDHQAAVGAVSVLRQPRYSRFATEQE